MSNYNVSIYGKSDMGRVRTNNEDAFVAQPLWDENTFLAIAIDGVGGYEGGEIAADIARKTIPEFLSVSSNGERVELLKQAVTAANNAIFEARESDPEHGQMSCVLTAAIVDLSQKQINMAHVGDSRLYCYHGGVLKKLSHDHSLIGYREEIGDLSEEEAMHHPQRNKISRDVGSEKHKANDEDFIEAQVFPLQPSTTLLLCSDGLTDMITSATITSILNRNSNLEEKTEALIHAALEAGGKDNVTVVLFEFLSDEQDNTAVNEVQDDRIVPEIIEEQTASTPDLPKKKGKGKSLKIILIAVIGLLSCMFVAYHFLNKKSIRESKEPESEYIKIIDSLETEIKQLKTQNTESNSDSTQQLIP